MAGGIPDVTLWINTALPGVMEMVQRLHRLELKTQGPGFTALNDLLNAWIAGTGLDQGCCISPACTPAPA